jgi:hypothetical protein
MKKLAILALAAAGLFLALPGAASAHQHFVPVPRVWFPHPHFRAFFPVPVPAPAFYAPRVYAPAPAYAYPPPAYDVPPAYGPPVLAPRVYFHVPGVTFQIGGGY